ncbi:MAG: zinc transporter ZntB, partial [Pseudomonadota bacterium]
MTEETAEGSPLIFGFDVDGGNIRPLTWEALRAGPAEPSDGMRWIHLDRLKTEVKPWAESTSGVDPDILDALFREDTRPRALRFGDGWLVNLRGVNLNPGPQSDTMIALRIWVTPRLVMSLRAYRIRAAEDLAKAFEAGTAPTSSGGLVTFLADRLTQRLDGVVSNLGDGVDALEERLLEGDTQILKTDLAKLRRQAVAIRRYMAPQKDALQALAQDQTGPLSNEDRRDTKEVLDALARVTEDLEAARDRAQLVQDQIAERRGEEMNQRLFVLAIISAIFLPLGFITGLFGVNVGGMPGVASPIAFA